MALDVTLVDENAALIEAACEVMHDAYESAAAVVGWETQQRSRKPWAQVPEANQDTMRAAVGALLAALRCDCCQGRCTRGGERLGLPGGGDSDD